jgi:hypothetical protein
MRRFDRHNHSKRQWRVGGPVPYIPAGQRGCRDGTDGDFHCGRDGHGPSELPVAKKWKCNKPRDFFFLHDSTHDGFR